MYIRAACQTDRPSTNPEFKPDTENVTVIKCRFCDRLLCENVIETLPLPTSNWEILSELWNCHPSHNQYAPIEMKEFKCYSGLFFYAFKMRIDESRYSLSVLTPFIECNQCRNIVGFVDSYTEELGNNIVSFFKHRVKTNEGNLYSIAELTSNAVCYN